MARRQIKRRRGSAYGPIAGQPLRTVVHRHGKLGEHTHVRQELKPTLTGIPQKLGLGVLAHVLGTLTGEPALRAASDTLLAEYVTDVARDRNQP